MLKIVSFFHEKPKCLKISNNTMLCRKYWVKLLISNKLQIGCKKYGLDKFQMLLNFGHQKFAYFEFWTCFFLKLKSPKFMIINVGLFIWLPLLCTCILSVLCLFGLDMTVTR